MAREITVSSTTDTQEAVNAAASYGLKTAAVVEQPEVETEPQPSEADEAETAVGREPDTEEEQELDKEPPEEEEEEEEPEPIAQTPEQPVSKSRRKLQRRLSRMHGENLTLKEKVEQLEERVRRAEAGEKPAQEAAPGGLVKPVQSQFQNDEEYADALADYKIALRDQAARAKAQEEYLKNNAAEYERQVAKARETYDDFDQAVGTEDVVPDLAIEVMKHELDNGADVAYYLAKHPEIREELLEYNQPGFRGGRVKIAARLAQISESLSSKRGSTREAAPRPRPSTYAPPPIRPVGTASARSTQDPGKMDMPDYKRWYKEHFPNSR